MPNPVKAYLDKTLSQNLSEQLDTSIDKKQILYQALLKKKALKGKEDLFYFNKYIIETNENNRKNIVPHVHGEWWEWYKNSKSRIKMILVPRGTFKSTFFTRGLTLWKLVNNKDERILIANATATNARRFLGEIKDVIRYNEEFKALYGDWYDADLKWNEDEFNIKGRSAGIRESAVTAVGVGGNLVSQHYSMIIADDLVNEENSSTKLLADKVIDWWRKSLSLLDPDGEYLIIGTRWSYYELYSYIRDTFKEDVDVYIKGAYNEDGSLYFPERLNKQKLKELEKLHGPYFFSAFYLNNPVDPESALIKESQIKYYSSVPRNLLIFSACDPAVSQSVTADYSSITTVGVDPDDNWYVLEVRRGRWTVGELVDNLFSVYKEFEPLNMSIEVIGQAQGLLTPIKQEEERRKIYLPLIEIKARGQVTKESRIRSVLQPRFERGKIYIKEDMLDLKDELLTFPRGRHDDIIDSLTDIEEIYWKPEEQDEYKSYSNSKLHNQLKYGKTNSNSYDPIMGEYF